MERTHSLWKISKGQLQKALNSHRSLKEIIESYGLRSYSNNYRILKQRIKEDSLDLTIFHKQSNLYRKELCASIIANNARPLEDVLIQGSSYNRRNIKKRLMNDAVLRDECYLCGLKSFWNGKPLILQLDHINGINNDNRIENLRLLCPNCHSQTETFSGKSFRKIRYYCIECGGEVGRKCKYCSNCRSTARRRRTKICWPPLNELIDKLRNSSFVAIAKLLGVSDTAIRHRLISHGVDPKSI